MRRYHIPTHPPDQIRRPDAREVHRLDRILANQEKMMASLDETLANMTEERSKIESLVMLVNGIKKQLDDAFAAPGAGTILSPEVQAKVDAIFAAVEQNKAAVQAAIDANTSAAKAGPNDHSAKSRG